MENVGARRCCGLKTFYNKVEEVKGVEVDIE